MQFENIIREAIEEKCEDYFLGTADLSLAKDPMIQQYKPLIAEYPQVISIGITLPKLSDKLKNESNEIYNKTNCQLKFITAHLSSLLEEKGYKVFSLPKADKMTDETFVSLHKLAANLAGLGRIDKSGLLVTPEVGTEVNWGTVLTNALL